MDLEREQQSIKLKAMICGSILVADSERLRCRGSRNVGLNAADERAAHNTELEM